MGKPGEKFYNNNRIELPEGFDPYDIDLKKQLHEKADDKNFIHIVKETPVLVCGAKRRSGKPCTSIAGFGTEHLGHGRCKIHGGLSTGPVTEEGKAAAAQNSRVHGLYSAVLGPEEKAIFDDLVQNGETGLKYEIIMLKAKILAYLGKWRQTYEAVLEEKGELQAENATKIWFSSSSDDEKLSVKGYYHAGTIEDRTLDRALNTLRRLCDTYSRQSAGGDGDSLINQVNAELKAASYGQVSLSWGGKAQSRKEGGTE